MHLKYLYTALLTFLRVLLMSAKDEKYKFGGMTIYIS